MRSPLARDRRQPPASSAPVSPAATHTFEIARPGLSERVCFSRAPQELQAKAFRAGVLIRPQRGCERHSQRAQEPDWRSVKWRNGLQGMIQERANEYRR